MNSRDLTPTDLNNIATSKPIKKWEEQLEHVMNNLLFAAEKGKTGIQWQDMSDWVRDQLKEKGFYVEYRGFPISKTLVYFGEKPWNELSAADQSKSIL